MFTSSLAIDIETYSSADLAKCGVYKYAEAPDFDILLIAFSFNGSEVELMEAALPENPLDMDWFKTALQDPTCKKSAYNAAFERTCLSKFFGIELDPAQWECTMVKSLMLGLPGGLDNVAKVLKLQDGKDAAGKALIRYFCQPCKPTKTNGQRSRNLPHHAPEKWEAFKNYCRQDVRVEREISQRISFFEPTPTEVKLWQLDQKINDHGVLLDRRMVLNAIQISEDFANRLSTEVVELTGLENPNSVAQLKGWLLEETGEEVATLNKKVLEDILVKIEPGKAKRMLQLRQEMSKSSVKKYTSMAKAVCADNRVRGLLQYYGASRTGRWAGRLVQVQNLPQNHLEDLDLARNLVVQGEGDILEICFGNVPDTLSQLIRTAFIAPEGHRFIPSDFSAIEARVIAWLAGEKWRMDVFNTHGKIYEASAAQMFKVPLESISYKDEKGGTVRGRNYSLRAKGKIAELALGYGGGPGALVQMGALKMGLEESELFTLVRMWRNANKAIVALWRKVEDAAIEAVENGCTVKIQHGISFSVDHNTLFVTLPSGRKLSYLQPLIQQGKFGPCLTYKGLHQTTKQWIRQDTYGGKLVENIVQAIARDCLAVAMLRLDEAGYKIVMHIHDEIVPEVPYGAGSVAEIKAIMAKPIPWAPTLPLKADCYETKYYKKD